MSARRGKFNAVPTMVDNVRFASKKEANHYQILKVLFHHGKIGSLEVQPRYRLEVNGQLICTYVADFRYVDLARLETIVEDVKGFKTPAYKLKKKLMKALLNIEVVEV